LLLLLSSSASDLIILQGTNKCLEFNNKSSVSWFFLAVDRELSDSSRIRVGSKKYSTIVFPVTYKEEVEYACETIKENLTKKWATHQRTRSTALARDFGGSALRDPRLGVLNCDIFYDFLLR
jgi:hypothetical protein